MKRSSNSKIFLWRENIETLPDDDFFNLIHIYLGEVRTPYNKQNLVERLEAFVRNSENQKTLLDLLDSFDKEILSFIFLVPNSSPEKIVTFFSDEYSQHQISTRLQNLHERLIIYTDTRTSSAHKYIRINPALENLLEPIISDKSILMPIAIATSASIKSADLPKASKSNNEIYIPSETFLTPTLVASFLAYISDRPDLCKADGTLKKTDATKLATIFPDKLELIQDLLTALVNLSLVNSVEKSLVLNAPRLEEFAKLSELEQYVYLCVAASCPMSRTLLHTQAQLLIDVIAAIPAQGFSRKNLLRAAFLISEAATTSICGTRTHGRFSRMLAAAATETDVSLAHEDRSAQILFDRTIDTAIVFGLISPIGDAAVSRGNSLSGGAIAISAASGGNFSLAKNTRLADKTFASESTSPTDDDASKKVITISGLSLTIVPGLTFAELLQLIPFLSVTQYNTAVSFEISHASVFRAFDLGYDSEKIFSLLEKYSAFDVPQSIHATVTDWEQSYHSAVLYKGYVLKLDEKNAQVFEKNPNVADTIIKKLAPGVYFLNITNDDEAARFSHASGFDFIGSTQSAEREASVLPFMSLSLLSTNSFVQAFQSAETTPTNQQSNSPLPSSSISQSEIVQQNLFDELIKLDFPKNKRDALQSRIERKIILSPSQLSASYVPQALLEAHGVDYSGKIHVLEAALQAHDKVTVTLPDEADTTKLAKYTGVPIFINKKNATAELVLQLDKSNDIKKFSIAQLTKIKWQKKM